MWVPWPTEPVTPQGWAVAFWAVVVALLGLAGLAVVAAWRVAGWADAPMSTAECLTLAAEFAGVAVALVVARWVLKRLLDL